MDALFAVYTRRSVRQYDSGGIGEEQVENLLRAGMAAPSAGNSRPWHFIVIDDAKKLSEISDIHPHAKMAVHAALAIVVCADPTLERSPGYWPQDCAAATQNILIAAHAQGLGAVWCGIYPGIKDDSSFRKLFCLPDSIVPLSLVVLGPQKKEPEDPGRYDKDRVHRNVFTCLKSGA